MKLKLLACLAFCACLAGCGDDEFVTTPGGTTTTRYDISPTSSRDAASPVVTRASHSAPGSMSISSPRWKSLWACTSVISKSKTCAVFINQIRHKIGVMYGSPETTPGGLALKFHASVRIDIRRIASIKRGDAVIGSRTKVKVVKNKLAPPFRRAEFDIIYGEGISKYGELVDLSVDSKIIQKAGSWYSFGDERIGQGRDAVIEFLKENQDITIKIEERVREELNLPALKKGEDKQSRTTKKE